VTTVQWEAFGVSEETASLEGTVLRITQYSRKTGFTANLQV